VIDVTTSVEIARPVREVFAFVADQTNAPQWQTDLHEVRRLTDGPMEFCVRAPLSLLEPVLSRLLAKDSRRDEQRLKSLLEHGDPSA
jgi:uncharacterized membrane protein